MSWIGPLGAMAPDVPTASDSKSDTCRLRKSDIFRSHAGMIRRLHFWHGQDRSLAWLVSRVQTGAHVSWLWALVTGRASMRQRVEALSTRKVRTHPAKPTSQRLPERAHK